MTYLQGVPGYEEVNPAVVAAHFGPEISGADIREIVRRTVLVHGEVSDPQLIRTVRSGRFRAQFPQGPYL